MKTRRIVLVLMLIAVMVLYGCGTSKTSESDNVKNDKEAAEETKEEEKDAEKEKEEAEDSKEDKEDSDSEKKESVVIENQKVDLTKLPQTIIDTEELKFEVKDIVPDDDWGYTLKVYMENNGEETIMFNIESASVNGVMCDPFWAAEVTAGKKSNQSITWDEEDLVEYGIDEVTAIVINLETYYTDNYDDGPVNGHFTLYPKGEKEATKVERTPEDSDIVLFENDKCSMRVIGCGEDDFHDYTVKAYIENKTDNTLMFFTEDGAINGFMADPFWGDLVMPQSSCYADISWSNSQLKENEIEKVESIELNMSVYDYDNYNGENIVEEVFTFEP